MQVTPINRIMQDNITFTSEHNKIVELYNKYHVSPIQRVRLVSEFTNGHTGLNFVEWLERKLKNIALDK